MPVIRAADSSCYAAVIVIDERREDASGEGFTP
jgi:hypothetical protein